MTVYRPTRKILVPVILNIALFALVVWLDFKVLSAIGNPASDSLFLPSSPLLDIAIAALMTPIGVVSLTFVISFLFASLRISHEGIVYNRWPLPSVKATWDKCDRISTGQVASLSVATLLVRRETPGREFKMGTSTLGSRDFRFIPLSDFRGWSDGRIREEIRIYAPRLVERNQGDFAE